MLYTICSLHKNWEMISNLSVMSKQVTFKTFPDVQAKITNCVSVWTNESIHKHVKHLSHELLCVSTVA